MPQSMNKTQWLEKLGHMIQCGIEFYCLTKLAAADLRSNYVSTKFQGDMAIIETGDAGLEELALQCVEEACAAISRQGGKYLSIQADMQYDIMRQGIILAVRASVPMVQI
jgi:hypothetical protein